MRATARCHCSGLEENSNVVACCFNPRDAGQKAIGKFAGKCFWCSPKIIQSACRSKRSRRAAARTLASLRHLDKGVHAAAHARVRNLDGGQEVVRLADAIFDQRSETCEVTYQFKVDDFKEMAGWFEDPSVLDAVNRVLGPADCPHEGEPILILQKMYWKSVISGEKTVEIRGRALQPMRRHVGRSGEIWGAMVLGPATRVRTVAAWKRLAPRHCWDIDHLPYKVTYAHPIFQVDVFDCPIRYKSLRGQVGNAKYRPPLDTQGAAGSSKARTRISKDGISGPAKRTPKPSKRKNIEDKDKAWTTRPK